MPEYFLIACPFCGEQVEICIEAHVTGASARRPIDFELDREIEGCAAPTFCSSEDFTPSVAPGDISSCATLAESSWFSVWQE